MIGTDENPQVTAVISHLVRPGRKQGYEAWLHGIALAAKHFEGYQGVSVIRPENADYQEFVTILRFDHYCHLKRWLTSDTRREWSQRLRPLIEKPETIQALTGLETWFSLPNHPQSPPPPHKMAIVTWVGVQIVTLTVATLLKPVFAPLPLFINLTISNMIVVLALTYLVMPQLIRVFKFWLYPKHP